MQVCLFGPFRLLDPDIALTAASARALLTYLLLYPDRAHSREKLADLLWPEAPFEQGRRGLSNALYKLRQGLGACVVVEEGSVRLASSGQWRVDVWTFDRLARVDELTALRQAVELYSGDLAPEIYDDWISAPRRERHDMYITALETLAERLTTLQQLHEALHYARRLVQAEPLREHNQQAYLRLLGRLGRRAEALKHYHELCALLQAELGIDPMPETQAIAADLRREGAATPAASEALPFVGRAAERATLIQQLERLLAGQGAALAIEGQPGLGKSRLLRELAASARWRNIAVLAAPSSSRPPDSPLAPLQAAFSAALSGPRRAQLELALSAEVLAACAPLVPAWQTRAALPELPPAHQQYRMRQALDALLGELTRLTPILLLLDDWHWADPLAWSYLDALVHVAPAHRCLLVVTWRRTELEARHEWASVETWEREGRLPVLTLQPWTFAELTAALPSAQHGAAERLWAVSSGNPFLLTEALHALSQGRMPETDVVARAQSLPADVRSVLACAAVVGRHVPLDIWSAATGLPAHELALLGDVCTQGSFLHPAEHGYTFAHDLVQAALYQAIPGETRRHWHSRCGEALASLRPDQQRARAFHLDHAGHAAAAALYRQVSAHALRLGAYVEARSALQRALELAPEAPSPERAEMLLELARLHFITDESAAEVVVAEAVRVTEALHHAALQARAALLAGELAIKTGRRDAARTALTAAMAHAQASADDACQAEVHHQLGELALREGQMLEARAQYAQELELARQLGDRAQEATALEGLGFALANSGGTEEETLRYLRAALALRRTLGDRFKEAQSLLNLFSTLQAAGHLDETLALGQEALSVNEAIGYARGASIVRGTLAQSATLLGQFDQAHALISTTLDYFRQVNDPEAVGIYTDTLGLIAERAGDLPRAEALLREAKTLLESQRSDFLAAFAQMDLGALYVRAGRRAEAVPVLEQASWVFASNQAQLEHQRCLTLLGLAAESSAQRLASAEACWRNFQALAPEGEERQYYLWELWQLLSQAGRAAPAAEVLRTAYATLQQQAQRIKDPALRQSFFERVPVNRAIVAAYAELAPTVALISARVVRQGVPLGRALTDGDYVDIQWTVSAPQDLAVADRTERRRFVLRRLLGEAARQAAAPTDDDLARALAVSRRTILRDMEALGEAGVARPTRKRKR